MTIKEELEKVKRDRECDTEWLDKYKHIVDVLQQIEEIYSDDSNDSFDDWTAISCGLAMVSKLMQNDIDGRNEDGR